MCTTITTTVTSRTGIDGGGSQSLNRDKDEIAAVSFKRCT